MKNTTIAVDLAKSVFEIGISDRPGRVSQHHRLSGNQLADFFAAQAPATVVIEACSSSLIGVRAQAQRFHLSVVRFMEEGGI